MFRTDSSFVCLDSFFSSFALSVTFSQNRPESAQKKTTSQLPLVPRKLLLFQVTVWNSLVTLAKYIVLRRLNHFSGRYSPINSYYTCEIRSYEKYWPRIIDLAHHAHIQKDPESSWSTQQSQIAVAIKRSEWLNQSRCLFVKDNKSLNAPRMKGGRARTRSVTPRCWSGHKNDESKVSRGSRQILPSMISIDLSFLLFYSLLLKIEASPLDYQMLELEWPLLAWHQTNPSPMCKVYKSNIKDPE